MDTLPAMIVTDAVSTYLASLHPDPDPVLAEMEAHADRDAIPIVTPDTGELLQTLAAATGARRIVEVGTAIGVSTLYLARGLRDGGTVVSFEVDTARHESARDYLERAGLGDRVDLRLEDARSGLAGLEGPFDLAFIDAVKQQYGDYLEGVLRILRPGALIVADNVLMSGTVATGRPDGGWSEAHIANARAFNERLHAHPEIEVASVLPVGDGVALAVRGPEA
jgi:predicted O-methyltransferase YrrM